MRRMCVCALIGQALDWRDMEHWPALPVYDEASERNKKIAISLDFSDVLFSGKLQLQRPGSA